MGASTRSKTNRWVVLSPREEMAWMDRTTTDATLMHDLEASARERGLVYCDECGIWFQSNCQCDPLRVGEDL